jgi:hypothetical protein
MWVIERRAGRVRKGVLLRVNRLPPHALQKLARLERLVAAQGLEIGLGVDHGRDG